MSIDPKAIDERSMEILTHLVKEIGPRPAGSAAEAKALDWLEGQVQSAGLQTRRFPVRYQADAPFFPYFSVAAAGFLVTGLMLPTAGWVTLLLPVLIYLLPEGMLWLQGKVLPYKDGSSNLLALPENTKPEEMDLILCAHVDSSRAVPDGPALWKKWRDRVMYTMMRVANILIIPGLFQMLGINITGFFQTLGQSLAWAMAGLLLAQDIWEQVGSNGRYSPGANDNGSGTALLAASAISLAKETSMDLKVGYLFTGAEETGLHGARQFALFMTENKMKIPVISVDMVGAGSALRIITRCGTVAPVKTNPALNELIKRADPSAVFHAAPRRWGDFAPFAQAGIPAAHVENNGTPKSWSTYHTPGDTLTVINPEMMQYTGEVIVQLLWILEKNKTSIVE